VKKMKNPLTSKQVKTIGVIALIVFVATIWTAVAISSWSGTRTYTKPTSSFTVDKPVSLDYGTVDSALETFTVTNTGNVALTITASATGSGATYGWDKTSAIIQPQATAIFTLTLTVTASGSTTVTFTPN
jgi:hypothetical protein